MLHFLKKSLKKFVAVLMVLSIIFSTNAFNTLSKVYADGIATKSSFVKNTKDESSTDEMENQNTIKDEDEEDEKPATISEIHEDSDSISIAKEEKEDDEKENDKTSVSTASETSEDESTDKKKDNIDDEAETDITSTKSEINKDNEIENEKHENEKQENEDVASESEVTKEIKIATENEIKAPYNELDTYSQITFYDKDAAVLDGTVIKLEKDLELKDVLYFKNGLDLDLAGHNIYSPSDNYAIYVENNFTLYNTTDTLGKIEGKSNEYPTIYLNNASVTFSGGKIYGAKGLEDGEDKKLNGGDAIHSYNSDLTFSGSLIYGGNGEDNDKEKGGNGGDAVVIMTATKTNKIYVESGTLKGGDGGSGLGDFEPEKGAALKVENKVYENQYFGKGLPGNVGGGSGGVALNIKAKKFKSNNLGYEDYTLNAGHAGYSKKESINKSAIKAKTRSLDDEVFGTGAGDSYYSLHDLDGKNYLTSLKSQGSTGLCTAFSTTAYAETSLIKNYPNYVKNILGKDVDNTLSLTNWSSNANELNLSEIYFGMQMFTQSKDEFGNAGLSRYLSDVSNESGWANNGANTRFVLLFAKLYRI